MLTGGCGRCRNPWLYRDDGAEAVEDRVVGFKGLVRRGCEKGECPARYEEEAEEGERDSQSSQTMFCIDIEWMWGPTETASEWHTV